MANLLSSAAVLAGELQVDTDTVTPGVLGFLTIFAIAVGLYLLMRNLLGKLRGLSGAGTEVEEEPAEHTRAEADDGSGTEEADETGAATADASGAESEDSSAPRASHP